MMRDVPIALIGSLRVPHSFIDGTAWFASQASQPSQSTWPHLAKNAQLRGRRLQHRLRRELVRVATWSGAHVFYRSSRPRKHAVTLASRIFEIAFHRQMGYAGYAGYAASCRNGEIKKIPPPRSVIHAWSRIENTCQRNINLIPYVFHDSTISWLLLRDVENIIKSLMKTRDNLECF